MPSLRENIASLPRHERLNDMLAASEDLHPSKTRRIEFVGDYNPMNDDEVVAKLLMSECGRHDVKKPYTEPQCKSIRYAAAMAIMPIPGHVRRLMEHNHQLAVSPQAHLSRTYQWDASNNFICDVDFHDVDVLLGGDAGNQFRDITDREPDEPAHIITPSPEVFKLIATEAVPAMAARGVGPQRGQVVAAH